MRLSPYLRPDLILTDLEGRDVTQVIRSLSRHLAENLRGVEENEVERGLLEREASHTTSMGHGVAIPHATIPGLDGPVLMVARADEVVPFGPAETDPVWLFFVLLSPPDREREHIKLLARICRCVRHPGFMDELRDARDADAILSIIEQADGEHA